MHEVTGRLRPQWGVHGPWLMAVAYLTVLGFLLLWRFRCGTWRKIRVFGHPAPMTEVAEAPAVATIGAAGGET